VVVVGLSWSKLEKRRRGWFTVVVVRDGCSSSMDWEMVVVGDVVVLKAGMKVPKGITLRVVGEAKMGGGVSGTKMGAYLSTGEGYVVLL